MYEFTLANIYGKQRKFKLCIGCNTLNWRDNDVCLVCESDNFSNAKEDIEMWVDETYEFYVLEGYTETEIDNILVET